MRGSLAAVVLMALAAGFSARAGDDAKGGEAPPALKPHLLAQRGDARFRHSGNVTSLVPLPDGKRALSTSRDGWARLWDLETGKELRRYGGGGKSLWGLVLLPGGTSFLTSGDDKQVKEWDLETGKLLRAYSGPEKDLFRCAASPDASLIVSAGDEGTVFVWAAGKPEPLHKLAGHSETVYGVAFSPDGKTAASGGKKNQLRLWDAKAGKELRELKGHEEDVHTVVFDAQGDRLLSASGDKSVRCWKVADGTQEWSFTTEESVYTLAWSPDGKSIAVSVSDGSVRILDAATGKEGARIGLAGTPWPAVYGAGGAELLAGICNTLCRYEAAGGKRLFPPPGDEGHLDSIDEIWPLEAGTVLTVEGKRVVRWKGDAPPELALKMEEAPSELCISPDGRQGVELSYGPELKLYDMTTLKLEETVKKEDLGSGEAVRWTTAGLRVLVSSNIERGEDTVEQLEVWSGKLERKLAVLEGDFDDVDVSLISGEGAYVAAVLDGDLLRVWDTASGKLALAAKLPHQEEDAYVRLAYLDGTGTLLAAVEDRLMAWRRPRPRGVPDAAEVKRLEKLLESEEYQERLEGVNGLVALGQGVLPFLTPPEKATDMEVRSRLKQVREQLGFCRAPVEPVGKGENDGLGKALVLPGQVSMLCAHPGGRHFVLLAEKDGRDALWWGEVADEGPRLLQQIEAPGTEPSTRIAFSPDGKFLYVATCDTRYAVFEVK
ncbi:MAG: PQQ-binding-like beta-propeller repeat protein [Planctomycetes bacterium]|nr:PQQ-binding-like beta-propeller repeat protein [Planctomycetota bacterium]